MAQRTGKDAAILLLGGYDVRPFTTELTSFQRSKVVEDITVFGVNDQIQVSAAQRRAMLVTKGFYNDAQTASVDMLLTEYPNDSAITGMVGLSGNTLGAAATMFSGLFNATFERAVKTGAFTHADASWAVTGDGAGHKAVDEGIILVPQAQLLAAGMNAQASYDTGQENANGMSAYLHVVALILAGYTSVTVRIEHSADNTTFTTLGTFGANVTVAPNAQVLHVAGTVHRYVRAFLLLNGAGTVFSIVPVVGFSLNPVGVA